MKVYILDGIFLHYPHYITKSKEDIEFLERYNKNNGWIGDFYFIHDTTTKHLNKIFTFTPL